MTDSEVYGRLFPNKTLAVPIHPDPDWDRVHRELAKKDVRLRLLHSENAKAAAAATSPRCPTTDSTSATASSPSGAALSAEWDTRPGETWRSTGRCPRCARGSRDRRGVQGPPVRGVPPLSRYSYFEPILDMKQDIWLRCHVHALEFLGGSTPVIVPDDLKTGVKPHPRKGKVALNPAYEEMSTHYGAAVIPVRVSRPRDKAGAENEVCRAATYVIAALRSEVFTDMEALRAAASARVREHNARPFSKREDSRLECFEEVERLLPRVPYEICEWFYSRKVQADCHQ